ncbi:Tol-Pal system beta propeller repeat protein TolB [Oceaniserpentilla sp. 4NH20-0058]|uniref:Tol-Pal system beta propeller repeat protein TolB n=1 Tax=Oceaniserpentilla sp. 4NH20-0058 TaxID=3127660 RepID=UPI0031069AF4
MMIRIIFLLSLFISATVRAELTIEITQGIASSIPIAVVPFKVNSSQAMPDGIDDIIRSDLERSGHFAVIEPKDMLSHPATEADLYFRDWRLLKQDYVVIGTINQLAGGQFQVRYQLFDVFNERELLTQTLKGTMAQVRDVSHRIGDAIYEQLTGIRGAFATKIAYVTTNSNRTRFNLSIADSDGAREQVILTSKYSIFSPAWAPDGKRIAYVMLEDSGSRVYVQDIASGKKELISSNKGLNSAPAFSPDGNKLALTLSKDGNPEIYVVDLKTRNLERITTHYGIDTEPNWMPDGKHIIFTSGRSGKPQIYRKNLETGYLERLTYEGHYNARARLAQDGRFLVLVHQSEKGGDFHIASLDLTRGLLQILSSDTYLDESPSVSPNGVMVMYAAKHKNRSILAAVSVDGDVKFLVPSKSGEVREPAWGPYQN